MPELKKILKKPFPKKEKDQYTPIIAYSIGSQALPAKLAPQPEILGS